MAWSGWWCHYYVFGSSEVARHAPSPHPVLLTVSCFVQTTGTGSRLHLRCFQAPSRCAFVFHSLYERHSEYPVDAPIFIYASVIWSNNFPTLGGSIGGIGRDDSHARVNIYCTEWAVFDAVCAQWT